MPKRIAPLTDAQVRNARKREKDYKLNDGFGLYLLVSPSGGKLWRLDYRYLGKRKTLAMGAYPAVTLSDARDRRTEAKRQIENGIDPGAAKKAAKEADDPEGDTFETVAREWHGSFLKDMSDLHVHNSLRRLETDVFPLIGKRPINSIRAPELLTVLRRIEARGVLPTAHLTRGMLVRIFRYAISTGRADRNPADDLQGALPTSKTTSMAAIIDPKQVAPLLRAIDGYRGSTIVRAALQLSPLVFVRPGELRKAQWCEIDFDNAEWNIPAERMKMRIAHLVPLSRQALDILRDLYEMTGSGRLLFPNVRNPSRAMSDTSINAALQRMGFERDEMTGHGFRAMARTIMDEVLGIRPDFIEHQLAHTVRGPLGRAYNRTSFLPERREMMQKWADYLDGLKEGGKVILLRKAE